jgi:signal transduction histidine kinase
MRAGENASTTGERAGPILWEGSGRFAAYLAHELRPPLANQHALLELALADPNTAVDGWREIGERVLRSCTHQERLLEACLALARSQGRARRRDPVDLAGTMAEALDAHDLCGLERVAVLEPAWTSGDSELLQRLAANLVSNAIRHNIAGGRIVVVTRTEPRRAVLSVANSGPPVPAADLERLFQPFQRLNPNTSASGDRVGLGLAIVRAIAHAHDATVTARAQPGGGLELELVFLALD